MKIFQTSLIYITIFLFSFLSITAQDFITITGQILDEKTQKSIEFSNIGLPKQGIGTTSGDNGEFVLKISGKYASEKIQISYIGYQTLYLTAAQIKEKQKIYLAQSEQQLTEIVVTDENDAKNIVRTAINKVPDNYPTTPTNVLGFYRESRTNDKNKYIYLAEGIIKVFKKTYTSKSEGQVSLIQGRKINLLNPLDTLINAAFSSGHMAPQRFDVVRNKEDFINRRFLTAYRYRIESVTYINDRPVWVISFEKDENAKLKKTKKQAWYMKLLKKGKDPVAARMQGKIYIEQSSYAIVRSEFEITQEGLKKMMDYPLYSGNWIGNYYVVNYKKIGDKWHFADALREGTYNGGSIYTNEVVITEINGGKGKSIPYLERMSKGDYFVNMTGEYDENFWKDYNTTPLNTALTESVNQMKNARTAEEVFDTEKMAALAELRDSMRLAIELESMYKDSIENEMPMITFGEPGSEKDKKEEVFRVKFNVGAGLHFLRSGHTNIGINYLTEDLTTTIVSTSGDMSNRLYEVLAYYDFDAFIGKKTFIRFGRGGDFYDSIHKETSFGIGREFNLSKGRPVYLVLAAQHSRLKYARFIGETDNEYGDFKASGKNINAEKVSLYYGSRTHNVKLSAELRVELARHQDIFIRGTYYLPFATRQDIYIKEKQGFFRKKVSVPVSEDRVEVTNIDTPFDGRLVDKGSFFVSVGFGLK